MLRQKRDERRRMEEEAKLNGRTSLGNDEMARQRLEE